MAVISAQMLVLQRVAVLVTVAFFLVKSADVVLGNFLVLTMAYSISLPMISQTPETEPFIVLLALFIFLLALSDLAILSVERHDDVLASVVPIRLIVYFAVAGYQILANASFGNGFLFSFCFMEIMFNFLIFLAVREERNERWKYELRKDASGDE